jgi:hypothetical protein
MAQVKVSVKTKNVRYEALAERQGLLLCRVGGNKNNAE